MSTVFLDQFERAYEAKLRELGVDDQAAGVDPGELGRRVALLVASRARWEEQLGPLLSSTDFQTLTGLSRQALAQAVEANRVVRLVTKEGRTSYPSFQLTDEGRLRPWLREVLREFRDKATSGWTTASWLTSAQPELDGRTPVEFVDHGGRPEEVVALAGRRAAWLAH